MYECQGYFKSRPWEIRKRARLERLLTKWEFRVITLIKINAIHVKAEGVMPAFLLDFPTQLNYVVGEGTKRTTFPLMSAADPSSRAELRVVQVPHAAPARPSPTFTCASHPCDTFQAFASHFSGFYTLNAGVISGFLRHLAPLNIACYHPSLCAAFCTALPIASSRTRHYCSTLSFAVLSQQASHPSISCRLNTIHSANPKQTFSFSSARTHTSTSKS